MPRPLPPELAAVLAPGFTHYQVLNLAPNEVGRPGALADARRQRAKLCHPDRWVGADSAAQQAAHDAMSRVNQAYETLSDAKAHRRYIMTTLAKTHAPCATCKGEGTLRRQKGFSAAVQVPCAACAGLGYLRKSGAR
jgi:DnaJ-class molecular chaperone